MGDADSDAAVKPAMIYPPQDIRTIIDKTAAHVAKSGVAFEKLLQDKYQGNARFAFMQPNDPYHAYYAHRVSQQHGGGVSEAVAEDEPMDVDMGDQTNEEAEDDYVPCTEQFGGSLPHVSAHDLDVLRLTAQFVARNGRSFLHNLMRQQPGHFAFAQPAHSLFAYFQRMVEQYTAVMFPPPDMVRELEAAAESKALVLDRVARRLRSAEKQAEDDRRREEEERREREEAAAIDWQDFGVVGTVEFVEEDEHAELPLPLLLRDVQQQTLSAMEPAVVPVVEPPAIPVPAVAPQAPLAPPTPQAPQAPQAPAPPGMRIRHDYVPTLRRGQAAATVLLRCQLCGQDVPASQFDEHLRVELVDPRWKEQKLAYERRFRDSNLVQDGDDMARYLRRLAHASAEKQEHEDATAPRAVPWDGFSATAGRATRRAREMQASSADAPVDTPSIGPAAGPPTDQTSRKRARNAKS